MPYVFDFVRWAPDGKLWSWLAWRLPRNLAYWAAVRVMTRNYGGSPDGRTCADALKGWQ